MKSQRKDGVNKMLDNGIFVGKAELPELFAVDNTCPTYNECGDDCTCDDDP